MSINRTVPFYFYSWIFSSSYDIVTSKENLEEIIMFEELKQELEIIRKKLLEMRGYL